MSSPSKYIKCYFCNIFHHKQFNICEVHRFKEEGATLCTYNTIWSLWKWFVRVGAPLVATYCTYYLVKAAVSLCKEVDIWRMLVILLSISAVVGVFLITIFMLMVGIVEINEKFRKKNGSYGRKYR